MTGRTEAALHAIEILRAWSERTPVRDSLAEERQEVLAAVVREMGGRALSADRMAACRRLLTHLAAPHPAGRRARPIDAA